MNHPWITFKLGDYFQPGKVKTAIALPELVRETNAFSIKHRPGCQPSLLKSKPSELYLSYNVVCHESYSDPNGHDVKVHFDLSQVHDDQSAKNLDVKVNCSCPAFLYWGAQWNSYMRDALEGEPRPELVAPQERMDLRDKFVICKHVKAVSERILPSVQYNINNILRKREVEKNKKLEEEKSAPKPTRKERLEQKQREMRERMEDKRRRPKQRPSAEPSDVVKRNTPATPEERERVPVLPPDSVPEPTPAHTPMAPTEPSDPNKPQFAPVPDLEEDTAPPPQPQKMPRIRPEDKRDLDDLMEEDKRKRKGPKS